MPSFIQRVLLLPSAVLSLTLAHALTITPRDTSSSDGPAPISFPPSGQWDGIDGSWSSFTLRIGTPPQDVRTFLSWDAYQTWAVVPQGCEAAGNYDQCAQTRGGIFNETASTSWEYQGLYSLGLLQNLGYYGNGYYGYDDVGLAAGGPRLTDATVAGYALEDFYVGVFGVNPNPTKYNKTNSAPSSMSLLKEQKQIPSVSFGYTAGAKYRDGNTANAFGSLILGGYDGKKFVANGLTWKFGLGNGGGDTVVALQSVHTPSKVSSSPVATELLPSPIYIYLDATVPQIWLPVESCYVFEYEFGLVYDNTTDLYLVNNTLHQKLLDRNASITFQLALDKTGGNVANIELPYSAFDLTASPPYQGVQNDTYYFPLRRAVNESQYTLGRAFFQEAYIAVDYEGETFNVSQREWRDSSSQNLVPILSGKASSAYPGTNGSSGSSGGLSGGAIAGIVVGAIAALAIIACIVIFFFRRRSQARKRAALENEKLASGSDAGSDSHATSGNASIVIPKAELPGSQPLSQHDSDSNHRYLASGALSTNGSSTPSSPLSPRARNANALSGQTFVSGTRWNGEAYSPVGTDEEGTGTHSSTGTGSGTASSGQYGGTLRSDLVSPLSPADSNDPHDRVFEMAGDMPSVKEKDGKELNEKEALAHREKVYNGVDVTTPITPMGGGGGFGGAGERRLVRPDEVVRAGTVGGGRHRAFSFEERREDGAAGTV